MSLYQTPRPNKLLEGTIHGDPELPNSGNPRYVVDLAMTDQPTPVRVHAWAAPQSYHQSAAAQYLDGDEVVVQDIGGVMSIVGRAGTGRDPTLPVNLFQPPRSTPYTSGGVPTGEEHAVIGTDSMELYGEGHIIRMGQQAIPSRHGLTALAIDPASGPNFNVFTQLDVVDTHLSIRSSVTDLTDVAGIGTQGSFPDGGMYFRATGGTTGGYHSIATRPFGAPPAPMSRPVTLQVNFTRQNATATLRRNAVTQQVTGVDITLDLEANVVYDVNQYFRPEDFFRFTNLVGVHESAMLGPAGGGGSPQPFIAAPTITNSYLRLTGGTAERVFTINVPAVPAGGGRAYLFMHSISQPAISATPPVGADLLHDLASLYNGVNLPGTPVLNGWGPFPVSATGNIDVVAPAADTNDSVIVMSPLAGANGTGPAYTNPAASFLLVEDTSTPTTDMATIYRVGNISATRIGFSSRYRVSDRSDITRGYNPAVRSYGLGRVIYFTTYIADATPSNTIVTNSSPPYITQIQKTFGPIVPQSDQLIR